MGTVVMIVGIVITIINRLRISPL